MRNPIFSSSTLFTDADFGKPAKRVTGDQSHVLSDGSRIVLLDTRQALVRVTTGSGIMIDISPETAFSLCKNKDGDLLRWQPVFNPSALNPLIASADLPDSYPDFESEAATRASIFIAGLLCGSGTHNLTRSRASSITVPTALAAYVEEKILNYVETLVERRVLHAYSMRHAAIDMQTGAYYLRSRVLSYMADGLVTEKLQQPTDRLYELLYRNQALRFVFLRALLSSLLPDSAGKLTFYNRDASVVEWVGDSLWHDFGVPCKVSIDPMEPIIQPSRSSARPHHIEIDADGVFYAIAAGLRDGVYRPEFLLKPVPDPIVSVVPLESRQTSVIVVPGRTDRTCPLTANGLQFNAAFSMPTGIESIATHPSLVNDPAHF